MNKQGKALTDTVLKNLKATGSKYYVMDAKAQGFGVRVGLKGTISFVFRYRIHDRRRTMALGTYPAVKLKQARSDYTTAKAIRERGGDPLAERQEQVAEAIANRAKQRTLTDVFNAYKDAHASKKSINENIRTFNHDIKPVLGNKAVGEIHRADIAKLRDLLHRKGLKRQTNIVVSLIRTILDPLVERDELEINPAWGVKKVKENPPRSRVLSVSDLRQVINRLPESGLSETTQAVIWMLIHTGQRRSEVCQMEWPDIDFNNKLWLQPAAKSKNGYDNSTPLSPAVIEYLENIKFDGGWVFPGKDFKQHISSDAISRAVARKQEHFGLPRWTPHDARRSLATGLSQRLHTSQEIIDKVLNHVPPKLERTYNHHDFIEVKREALDGWAELLEDGKVIKLKRA